MTNQLATARAAITAEIQHLAAQQAKLEQALRHLLGDRSASSPVAPMTGLRRRGRPPLNKIAAAASPSNLNAALMLIEQAGKKGIKALKLAYELKIAGGTRPAKAELLGSKQVKLTGKGGGSTYIWTA